MDHGAGGNDGSDYVSGLALWAALTAAAMVGAVLGIAVLALVNAGR